MWMAYDRLLGLPVDQRIPVLLSLISVPVPPAAEGEITTSSWGGTEKSLDHHPSVVALTGLGKRAEPAVIRYIASDPDHSTFGVSAAIQVMVTLEGPRNAVAMLKTAREKAGDGPDASRITAAITQLGDDYCYSRRAADPCSAAPLGR